MRAKEFMAYASKHYGINKKKWSARLKKQGYTFSEDIYQDTIYKVYNQLQDHEIDDAAIEAYWYQSFLTNTKRECEYSHHNRDENVDVLTYLDEFPNDDPPILLEDIEDVLRSLTTVELHLILIYYLTDTSYKQLEELTGIKNVRYKIKGIIKKIKERVAV